MTALGNNKAAIEERYEVLRKFKSFLWCFGRKFSGKPILGGPRSSGGTFGRRAVLIRHVSAGLEDQGLLSCLTHKELFVLGLVLQEVLRKNTRMKKRRMKKEHFHKLRFRLLLRIPILFHSRCLRLKPGLSVEFRSHCAVFVASAAEDTVVARKLSAWLTSESRFRRVLPAQEGFYKSEQSSCFSLSMKGLWHRIHLMHMITRIMTWTGMSFARRHFFLQKLGVLGFSNDLNKREMETRRFCLRILKAEWMQHIQSQYFSRHGGSRNYYFGSWACHVWCLLSKTKLWQFASVQCNFAVVATPQSETQDDHADRWSVDKQDDA